MRKIATLLIIICAICMVAKADGWQYGSGKAGIESHYEFINGDFNKPTVIQLFVGINDAGEDGVMAILEGECDIHNFRDNQQYVMIEFDGQGRQKWAIQQVPYKDRKFKAFIFGNASDLIKRLRESDIFTITLPLLNVGTRTFYFYTDGYPLDY